MTRNLTGRQRNAVSKSSLVIPDCVSLAVVFSGAPARDIGARHGYQWFLKEVQRVSPALADALHETARRKPFAVSTPQPLSPERERGNAWFRVAVSGNPAAVSAALEIERQQPEQIRVAGQNFNCLLMTTSSDRMPWAGTATIAALMEAARRKAEHSVTLRFHSPTAFSAARGRLSTILPVPQLVYGSLARRWNQCALDAADEAHRMDDPALRALTNNIDIEDLQIDTADVDPLATGRLSRGFVGQVRYALSSPDEQLRRWFHALSAFAFYAGVGERTTHGMGQVDEAVAS